MLRTPTSRVAQAAARSAKAGTNPLTVLKKAAANAAAQQRMSTVVEGIQKVCFSNLGAWFGVGALGKASS